MVKTEGVGVMKISYIEPFFRLSGLGVFSDYFTSESFVLPGLCFMQKIKENFISFRNIFLKNKKRVNQSNFIVKTKKCIINIEIGIFVLFDNKV